MKKVVFLFCSSIFISLLLIIISGCKKETIPSLTTSVIESLTPTSAIIRGIVKSEGESPILSRGICWSTNPIPTLNDSIVSIGGGADSFTVKVTGLIPDTKYYVRAYATNILGTGYGSVISFTTENYGSVTDVDGNIYKTVNIGSQEWMAENLKTTKYRNGDLIGTTEPINLDISDQSSPKYQWDNYNGTETNVSTYGRLYTWYTVTDNRGICPAGWHVPTDVELENLTTFLGGIMVAGGKLKEAGTTHWISPNTDATNESGFSALPGADRDIYGNFFLNGSNSTYWTSKELNIAQSLHWFLSFNDNYVSSGYTGKSNGFSIRCIKDN